LARLHEIESHPNAFVGLAFDDSHLPFTDLRVSGPGATGTYTLAGPLEGVLHVWIEFFIRRPTSPGLEIIDQTKDPLRRSGNGGPALDAEGTGPSGHHNQKQNSQSP